MTAEHNHPPRCCCQFEHQHGELIEAPCPACPEHGELAPAIECPQCHQPIGRPHTDFCTLAPDRVWPEPGITGLGYNSWTHRHADGFNVTHPAGSNCALGEPAP